MDHELEESVAEVRARVEDGDAACVATPALAGNHAGHGGPGHSGLKGKR